MWPLSRRERPKFLLDLTGAGRSLLQGTVARLAPVSDSITVVTGIAHVAAVAAQLPELDREQLSRPRVTLWPLLAWQRQ